MTDFQGLSSAWRYSKEILLGMLVVGGSLAALWRAQTGKFISDGSGDETKPEFNVYHTTSDDLKHGNIQCRQSCTMSSHCHNQPSNEYKSGKQAGDLFQIRSRTLLNPPQTPHCLNVRKQAE